MLQEKINNGKQKSKKNYLGLGLVVLVQFLLIWGLYTAFIYQNQNSLSNCLRNLAIALWLISEICYIRTQFSDPGEILQKTVPLKLLHDQQLLQYYQNICNKCNSWKPPRAHHCRRCNKCIFKMDHHCEWTNNCIGALNQKYFVLFLFYVFCYIITIFSIHIIGIYSYIIRDQQNIWNLITNNKFKIFEVFLFIILCTFFSFFVISMLWDQIQVIRDNQTVVESLQGKFGRQQSFFKNMKQFMGNQKWYYWILPTTPILKLNYAEIVYGEQLVNLGTSYLEDIIYDEQNPKSAYFAEFMVDNYKKKLA
ncbi:unnamed protein product [Paramecium pentaurelia]|uniref:Palmitoyltransferase n=1 Tax=Paramecium pentaurelia TaxID=43138 RepID=A0A8S1TMF4_9CILI|nr:unnamed protein product [Paramecium pentaurelia]